MTEGTIGDDCLRCGYDLRGVANAQPCPECGLLAERSRRPTDELHDTRPRWLSSLAWGVRLFLLAIAITVVWPFVVAAMEAGVVVWRATWIAWRLVPWLGFDAAAASFFPGILLLTAPEGYPPADRADARLRWFLRCAAAVPLVALLIANCQSWFDTIASWSLDPSQWPPGERIAAALGTAGCAPVSMLIFVHLRNLAKRARNPHLASHCQAIAFGSAIALLYIPAAWYVLVNGDIWFGEMWSSRSRAWLLLTFSVGVLTIGFLWWIVWLLIRFEIALRRALRELKRKWSAADRAMPIA